MKDCAFGGAYGKFAVAKYSKNPNANSEDVKSSVLKFTTVSSSSSSSSSSVDDGGSSSASIFDRELAATSRNTVIRDFTPAFYVVLGFSSTQDFNFTEDISAPGFVPKYNFTIPSCSIYDSKLKENIPCGTCNISSYNNYNVTFGCKDISVLCKVVSSGRRLFSPTESNYFESIVSRRLADDDGSSEGNVGGAQFGALLQVSLIFMLSTDENIDFNVFVSRRLSVS